MSGINGFFHIASALAALWMVYAALRLKRQRDLLRQCITELKGEERRVHVAPAEEFLERFAEALQIPFEREGGHRSSAGRITVRPVLDMFVTRGLSLIRCTDFEIQFHVAHVTDAEKDQLAIGLSGAMGSHVRVAVVQASK